MLHDKSNKNSLPKENGSKTNSLMDTFINQGTGSLGLNSLLQKFNKGSINNKGNSGSLLPNVDLGSLLNGVDVGSLLNNVDMESMIKGDTSSLLKSVDKNTVMKMASNLLNTDTTSAGVDLAQQDLSSLLNIPVPQGTQQNPEVSSLLGQLEIIEKQIAEMKSAINQANLK